MGSPPSVRGFTIVMTGAIKLVCENVAFWMVIAPGAAASVFTTRVPGVPSPTALTADTFTK